MLRRVWSILNMISQKNLELSSLTYTFILNLIMAVKNILDKYGRSDVWINQNNSTDPARVSNQIIKIIDDTLL